MRGAVTCKGGVYIDVVTSTLPLAGAYSKRGNQFNCGFAGKVNDPFKVEPIRHALQIVKGK